MKIFFLMVHIKKFSKKGGELGMNKFHPQKFMNKTESHSLLIITYFS